MTENTSEVQPETSVASDTVCGASCSFQYRGNSGAFHHFADASLLRSTLACSRGEERVFQWVYAVKPHGCHLLSGLWRL